MHQLAGIVAGIDLPRSGLVPPFRMLPRFVRFRKNRAKPSVTTSWPLLSATAGGQASLDDANRSAGELPGGECEAHRARLMTEFRKLEEGTEK